MQLLPLEMQKHHNDLLTLREFLIRYKNNGMDKDSMLDNLEELRNKSDSETEDILLELMDFVVGYCNPSLSIYTKFPEITMNQKCQKCNANMYETCNDSIQGWVCPGCGWNVVTTKIDKIYEDTTEYRVYMKHAGDINHEKIKLVSKIAGVNFVSARQMLMESNVCLLKDKAPKVQKVIQKLRELEISFEVIPQFMYK